MATIRNIDPDAFEATPSPSTSPLASTRPFDEDPIDAITAAYSATGISPHVSSSSVLDLPAASAIAPANV